MILPRVRAACWLLVLAGCDGGGHELLVDLRTDLRPGIELVAVRTSVRRLPDPASLPPVERPALENALVSSGLRIAEWAGLATGRYRVNVELLSASGALVASRPADVELSTDFGVTVLIMRDCVGVCGRLPFDEASAPAMIVALTTRPHRPLGEVVEGVPEALSGLVDRCLSKDPAGRPADANELARELVALLSRADVLTTLEPARARVSGPRLAS
ncbi:MAG: hypothetical protein IT378_11445 [Sandaracinaceae bacterium]|nr:hypothetical protein [Sandaracinaceae bacterium]